MTKPGLSIPECLDQGIAFLNAGRLTEAIECYQQTLREAPGNIAILNNLANTLQAAGRFAEANKIYLTLLKGAKPPLAWRVASNYLAGLQYQPEYSAEMLKVLTGELGRQYGTEEKWGEATDINGPVRIGFVSADLCDHPVGLFLLPLLTHLDRSRFVPILYSTGGRADHTAHALRSIAEWRDVANLDHNALLAQLRAERLHVLVDLAGHTAGNRLPVFARRAAPIQISWLGYFATTGIPAMDAVFMDEWHAPLGAETQFTERLIRFPHSRFCYSPVPFAPEVSAPPCLDRGFVTFGSFNNTSKLNSDVLAVWAEILRSVPDSRLVLKWPTFADQAYARSVTNALVARGIEPGRVELRGRSSHAEMLAEYADIDIALDPFPFTGGHTSCEALWMGLPVVTLPGRRPVSRQTLCFLSTIRMSELVASDPGDYVKIAVGLASEPGRLMRLRGSLRQRMRESPLMDAQRYARDFQAAILELVETNNRRNE